MQLKLAVAWQKNTFADIVAVFKALSTESSTYAKKKLCIQYIWYYTEYLQETPELCVHAFWCSIRSSGFFILHLATF